MNRWIGLLWLTTVLPLATLPWVTIAREQPQPWYSSHALFHIVYLPIIVVAIWAALQLARADDRRLVRILAWLIVAAETIGFVGHAGELIAVTQHGGFDAGEDIFDRALHEVPAALTVPAMFAGALLVVVTTITAAVQRGAASQAEATAE